MDFAGMNYVAVPVAALASFVFGSSWYAVLGSAWATAVERSKAELGSAKLAMLITAICLVIMAFVLAGLIGHLGTGQVTLANGIISAALVWTGFIATTLASNHAFQGTPAHSR